jgi:release factor glutamine methyltransferase
MPLGQPLARPGVDLITANPPYIPAADLRSLQPEVRDYEPAMALVGGAAGTEIHDRIIREAPAWLKQGGFLIMEMGIGQAEALGRLIDATGAYGEPEILKDLAGIDRVVIARKRES